MVSFFKVQCHENVNFHLFFSFNPKILVSQILYSTGIKWNVVKMWKLQVIHSVYASWLINYT